MLASNTGRTMLVALVALVALVGGCERSPGKPEDTAHMDQALQAIVATCAATHGTVEVMRVRHAYWEKVEQGAVFRPGDWVRTGPRGFARIEFLGGKQLELDERSVVLVERAPPLKDEAGGGALVSLEIGSMRGMLPADAEGRGAPLRVRTSEGQVLTVDGAEGQRAEFRLTRTERGTELSVSQGRLTLGQGAQRRTLERGQVLPLTQGLAEAPYTLLNFPSSLEPGVDARFQQAQGLRVALAWQPVPGAAQYQVQVARDLGFQQLVVNTAVKQPGFGFEPGGPGEYAWRVASRDAAGRLGEYGFARRLFVDEPSAGARDLLVAPSDGHEAQAGAAQGILFAWQSQGASRRYRLVVARDKALREPVHTHHGPQQQLELTKLPPGEYWWGAYLDGQPPEPLFDKARRLVVRKPAARKAHLRTPAAVDSWGP